MPDTTRLTRFATAGVIAGTAILVLGASFVPVRIWLERHNERLDSPAIQTRDVGLGDTPSIHQAQQVDSYVMCFPDGACTCVGYKPCDRQLLLPTTGNNDVLIGDLAPSLCPGQNCVCVGNACTIQEPEKAER